MSNTRRENELDAALAEDLGPAEQPCRCQEACCEDMRARATEDTTCPACGHTVEQDLGAWTSDRPEDYEGEAPEDDTPAPGSAALNRAMEDVTPPTRRPAQNRRET